MKVLLSAGLTLLFTTAGSSPVPANETFLEIRDDFNLEARGNTKSVPVVNYDGAQVQTPPPGPVCLSRPPDGNPWACDPQNVNFPTAACIAQDMLVCGLIGQNTVFYSFGASPQEVDNFAGSLSPRGVVFNTALGSDWWDILGPFRLGQANRQAVFTARFAQAMARVSRGTSYLACGANCNAYTVPPANPPNVWRLYEFPELQKNVLVSQVQRVNPQGGAPYTTHVDYRGMDSSYQTLPYTDADTIPVPP